MLSLSAYKYNICYKKGPEIANALSRLPLDTTGISESLVVFDNFENKFLSFKDIADETAKDTILSRVCDWVASNWPSKTKLQISYIIVVPKSLNKKLEVEFSPTSNA